MVKHYEGLVDHRGRPIEKKELIREVAGPTVTGVRSPLTGYPGDGLDPVRLRNILREADQGQPLRFYELAETIEERDLHYAGVLGVRKRSVAQIPISVMPAGDDAASVDQAKMVEDWLTRDTLTDELFEMLDAIGKGESFTEIGWDTSEGQWRPKTLDWRDQRWFRPAREDLTTPMLISENGEDMPLPGGKFIHLVARGKAGLPARSGLARLAAWFWLFKAMTTRDWAIYSATFGVPLRVGKYDERATEEDKDTLFRAVANIAGDCAAIIPKSMLIEFIQPPSATSTDVFEKRADWLDRQMSKAALGQTTTTDAISGGHAVSREHRQVQEDIERADAAALAAAINRDLVRVWIDLEYGPQKAYPRVVIARPDEEDLAQLTNSVAQLVPLGLRVSQREMRSKLGLSEPAADEELLTPRPSAPAAAPGQGEAGSRQSAVGNREIENGDPADPEDKRGESLNQVDPAEEEAAAAARALDALADDAGIRAADALGELIDLVGRLVAESASLEEVRSKLLMLNPEIPTRALALALRQAQVVARLTGRRDIADGLA